MTMIEQVARALHTVCPTLSPETQMILARAAILAMIEPTEAMLAAGMAAVPKTVDPIDPDDLLDGYRAMIDQALAEKPT
jgi:hypothetical protein